MAFISAGALHLFVDVAQVSSRDGYTNRTAHRHSRPSGRISSSTSLEKSSECETRASRVHPEMRAAPHSNVPASSLSKNTYSLLPISRTPPMIRPVLRSSITLENAAPFSSGGPQVLSDRLSGRHCGSPLIDKSHNHAAAVGAESEHARRVDCRGSRGRQGPVTVLAGFDFPKFLGVVIDELRRDISRFVHQPIGVRFRRLVDQVARGAPDRQMKINTEPFLSCTQYPRRKQHRMTRHLAHRRVAGNHVEGLLWPTFK